MDKIKIKTGCVKKFQYKDLNFNIGTMNTVHTKAAFLELTMWLTPKRTLETSIKAIRRRFKLNVGKLSRIYIDGLKTNLIDFNHSDFNSTAGVLGSPTFVSIEITLLANKNFDWGPDFIFEIENLGMSLYDILIEMDEFTLKGSKK